MRLYLVINLCLCMTTMVLCKPSASQVQFYPPSSFFNWFFQTLTPPPTYAATTPGYYPVSLQYQYVPFYTTQYGSIDPLATPKPEVATTLKPIEPTVVATEIPAIPKIPKIGKPTKPKKKAVTKVVEKFDPVGDLPGTEKTIPTDIEVFNVPDPSAVSGKPEKLMKKPSVATDLQWIKAVQDEDAKFIVEKVIFVPGKRLDQFSTVEHIPIRYAADQETQGSVRTATSKKFTSKKSEALKLEQDVEDENQVVVTAMGNTAADKPVKDIQDIPVLNFFSPYEKYLKGKETSLILEPSARAIAGNGGTAISAPVSRAILRKGSSTKVLFRPESVAIAGAYGTAHAHADLILDYIIRPAEHRAGSIRLPFYGGAGDRVLEFTENADGTYDTRIKEKQSLQKETLHELIAQEQNSFESNLKTIQDAASELVRLQDSVKQSGKMTVKQQQQYTAALERLGNSALRLANVSKDDNNDLRQLFETKNGTTTKTTTHTKKDNVRKESFPGFKVKPSKHEEKEEEEVTEESVGEAEEGTGSGGSGGSNDDSVAITPPDKDSSVAEAKPVALAIAGEGGVASSKPVATAVVGPGGLAVARPVSTAIAGVKPSEIGSLGIPVPIKKSGLRASTKLADGKYGFIQSDDSGLGLLVGPNFDLQARFSKNTEEEGGEGQHDEIMAEPEEESDTDKTKFDVTETPRMVNEDFINAIMPRLGLPKYSGYPNVPQYPMVNVPYYNMMSQQILPAEFARRSFAPPIHQYAQDRSVDEGQEYNRPYMPRPYFVYL